MRTTLTIDPDLMYAARELATLEGTTIGAMISELARAGLATRSAQREPDTIDSWLEAQGLRLFPHQGTLVTNADVNRLRDELFL